jgi:hypothetical protein
VKKSIILAAILSLNSQVFSQNDNGGSFLKPNPRNYQVNQALELESLLPMFFYGGWHLGVGYRYEKFRLRLSVINGGDYNADVQSIDGSIDGYKRYYTTSPGIYNTLPKPSKFFSSLSIPLCLSHLVLSAHPKSVRL